MTDQPDIEAIAERHNGSHSVRCVYWANSDPNETRCDTAIVIERLRAVEAERDRAESLGAAYRSTAWLWLDPDEPQPYFADEDWVWETDPYLDRAHRVTHNPPYGHLLCS